MSSVLVVCILLTAFQYSESSKQKSLLLFPIQSTPHMVYLDKKTRSTINLQINSSTTVSLNGKQFMASLQSGKFSLGQQIQDDTEQINQKVTEAPPLPMHGTFIVRKRDSNNNIKISIDWNKEYLVSKGQRPTSFAMQIMLYNFKGDYLGTSNVTKPTSNTSDIVTSFSPKSNGQKYLDNQAPDAHDILVAVLRTNTTSTVVSNASTYFIIYPDQFAKLFEDECDWTIDDIVNRQAAFMGMTMLHTFEDWKDHSFKFSFLALLSQTAGMTQTAFDDYKYLSIVKVPKTNSKNETYNLRDIGQRTGAGFGFIYWNRGGHQLSEKFDNKFKAQQILNNTLFKEFVVKCFEYGELLDPRTSEEKTNGTTVNYRNKEGNDNWSYQFGSQKLIGNRTMEANNQVKQISWTWGSDKWNTNADGTVKVNTN